MAVVDAFDWMVAQRKLAASPVRRRVAAVSVGVVDGEHGTFDRGQLDALLGLAMSGIAELGRRQAEALGR